MFVVNSLAKIVGCIVPKADPIEIETAQPISVDVSELELEPNTLVMMQLVAQMKEMQQGKDLSVLKPKEDSVIRVICLPGGSFVPDSDWSDALQNEHFRKQNVIKGHLRPYPQYSDPASLEEAELKEMCEHILVDTVLQDLIKTDPRVVAVTIYNARLTALEELRKVLYA